MQFKLRDLEATASEPMTRGKYKNLRSKVAAEIWGNENYKGIQIEGPGLPRKTNGVSWPFSNTFCRLLLLEKYPKLAAQKAQRRKAAFLYRVIYSYYRVSKSAQTIALDTHKKLKTIEKIIENVNKTAKQVIEKTGFVIEDKRPNRVSSRTSPCVIVVHNAKVVTDEPRQLKRLIVECEDKSIRDQALQALEELERRDRELAEIADHDRPLLAA